MPRRRSSYSSSSLFLSPPLLIILLPIVALLLLFFAVRPFLTLTSQIIRPISVKKSWDAVNILLVLFAILCGLFARRNYDGSTTDDTANFSRVSHKKQEEETTSQQWFQYSEERKTYDPQVWTRASPATVVPRLKRSSSSYPDLRQESQWENGDDRFQFRFFDDFEISKYRALRPRNESEELEVKEIPVDTFVPRSSSPPPPPTPPPPPPPAVHHKPKRTYHTVRHKDQREGDDHREFQETRSPSTPPPPPLPPPSPAQIRSEQKYGKSERRKSNAKREISMILASLYNQRKRKKKQKIKDVYDSSVHSSAEPAYGTIPPPSPRPPPPPPPPPPSVFQSLFKKGSKSKKVHSVPATPQTPPLPPAPPPIIPSRSSKRKTAVPPPPPEPSRRRGSSSTTTGRPPLPTRASNWDETASGAQNPLIPMPPPPPPPPFKMPEPKFVVRGGFVSIRSTHSSRSGSPELEDVDVSPSRESSERESARDGGDGARSVFCPSPDVNIKADTFIARLHDGWKLEKINSLREKQKMGLAPGPLSWTSIPIVMDKQAQVD